MRSPLIIYLWDSYEIINCKLLLNDFTKKTNEMPVSCLDNFFDKNTLIDDIVHFVDDIDIFLLLFLFFLDYFCF